MGHDFYPGLACGIIIGVLVTMIGLAIFCRTATTPKAAPETKNDPADWWKRGEKPPHDDDD